MLKRGELAKATQVSTETVRYYEQQGLIYSRRDSNGYRLFDDTAVERISFIQRAQKMGLTLKDIAELLEIEIARDQHTCEEVKAITQAKQQEIKKRIDELQCMYEALAIINDRCCGGPRSASLCTILTALADSELNQKSCDGHD
jgi:MerR family transcriptional regulator, Zn(II)-responsive regulator of zntA